MRQLVRRYLAPIRVCSGGVIDQMQSPGDQIPQLDTIAWIPGPVPAVFEVGEFALVPRSSCLGILGVKSSLYDDAKQLEEKTDPNFVGSVSADLEDTGHEGELLSFVQNGGCFGIGVVSLLQENQRGSTRLESLRKAHRVFVLFEEQGDKCVAQTGDIYRLINFLAILRFRAAAREGRLSINPELLRRP